MRLEFADVDGVKRASCLIIYSGGAVKAYLDTGMFPTIRKGQRIREDGYKIRFADLNGDGQDDFPVLYDGGAVKYWLTVLPFGEEVL